MVEEGHIKGLKGIARCLVLKGAVGGGFAGDAAGFFWRRRMLSVHATAR